MEDKEKKDLMESLGGNVEIVESSEMDMIFSAIKNSAKNPWYMKKHSFPFLAQLGYRPFHYRDTCVADRFILKKDTLSFHITPGIPEVMVGEVIELPDLGNYKIEGIDRLRRYSGTFVCYAGDIYDENREGKSELGGYASLEESRKLNLRPEDLIFVTGKHFVTDFKVRKVNDKATLTKENMGEVLDTKMDNLGMCIIGKGSGKILDDKADSATGEITEIKELFRKRSVDVLNLVFNDQNKIKKILERMKEKEKSYDQGNT